MFRALFVGKATSVITPEEYKAVEDQLNSKIRLLEETSRQLEHTKRQVRDLNEKLKFSQQKQDTLTIEIGSLQQQLRMAKQESTAGGKTLQDGKSEQSHAAIVKSLKQQITTLQQQVNDASQQAQVQQQPSNDATLKELKELKRQISILTKENKQLTALAQQQKNNAGAPPATGPIDQAATTATTRSNTDSNNEASQNKNKDGHSGDANKKENNNKELWEQLTEVLVRPSTLVD